MEYRFSLAHLTVMGCTPPELVHIAARAGYDFVSLRLIPLGLPGEQAVLPSDKDMVGRTKEALDETGIKLLDVELARILAHVDPKAYLPAMELGAEMGARHIISSAWTTESDDRDFIVERYEEICDLARPFGLTVELEFPTISRLTNMAEAVDIVSAANRPNGGILLDTLYLHYSGANLDDLSTLPREWIHFLHICDTAVKTPTTRAGMTHVIRDARLYLGEGCIDFNQILDRLPRVPLSIELPNAERVKELGYEGHARRCLETAKHYLKNSAVAV
jgi:sugar phosphate isomerase/epimerase